MRNAFFMMYLTLSACGREPAPTSSCMVTLAFDAKASDPPSGQIAYSAPFGCAASLVSDHSGRLAWRLQADAPPSPGFVTAVTAGPGRRQDYGQLLGLADGSTATDRVFDLHDGAWALPWPDVDVAESAFVGAVAMPPSSEPSLYPRRLVITLRAIDDAL